MKNHSFLPLVPLLLLTSVSFCGVEAVSEAVEAASEDCAQNNVIGVRAERKSGAKVQRHAKGFIYWEENFRNGVVKGDAQLLIWAAKSEIENL